MLLYKKQVSKNPTTKEIAYHLRAISTETIDLDGLAAHMASHNSPYSKGTIYGILTDMVACIRELTLASKSVKIPDLAIFSLGIRTGAIKDLAKLDGSAIRSAYIKARGTGEFRTREIREAITAREMSEYTAPKAH